MTYLWIPALRGRVECAAPFAQGVLGLPEMQTDVRAKADGRVYWAGDPKQHAAVCAAAASADMDALAKRMRLKAALASKEREVEKRILAAQVAADTEVMALKTQLEALKA